MAGVIHRADQSGTACESCGTTFGGPKSKLTVAPGTRVVSTGVGDAQYQTWFMPDDDVYVDGEDCATIIAEDWESPRNGEATW